MKTLKTEHAADPGELEIVVTITRMGKLWRLTWSEPRNVGYSLLWAYQGHCERVLVPSLRDRWPVWVESVSSRSNMQMAGASFGCLSHAPETVVNEAVAIIRAVFPRAAVTWPKGRTSRQSCDRCQHMSRDRTCTQPAAAGLANKHLPIWCDLMNGHGRICPNFTPTTRTT